MTFSKNATNIDDIIEIANERKIKLLILLLLMVVVFFVVVH